jgi:hypothetical protein
MSLDVNSPTDQVLVSEIPAYIRANRVAINNIESESSNITTTEVSISAGDTALVVGTDLSALKLEIALLSGIGASTIEYIRGGVEGQIKIFIFQDNDITFKDGIKEDGKLYLNQLPALSDFAAQQDDVIALVNIGGDGDTEYGYWKEVWRQLSVK